MSLTLGFTGTSQGMTEAQKATVKLLAQPFYEVHHGDCIGADEQFHAIVRGGDHKVWGHPPINPKARAYCMFDITSPAKEYLVRNRDIVAASDVLIAMPLHDYEELRSGTWSTVRFARKAKIPVWIVYPDGRVGG